MKFLLDIVTPMRQAYAESVDAVFVPTESGTIGILAHHVGLFTILVEGEIKIVEGSKEHYLAIGGGFLQVDGDRVSILVSQAVHAHEINELEIKKAIAQAGEAIKQKAKGLELSAAQALLRRSFVELKVLRRRHQSRPLNA